MKLFTLVRIGQEGKVGGLYYSHRLGDFTNPFERDLFTAESKHLVDTSTIQCSPGAHLEWRETVANPKNYYSIVRGAGNIVVRKKPYVFLQYAGDGERPRRYQNIKDATDAYRATASELARYGQSIFASLHFANLRAEIAEYPDRGLSFNHDRETVTTERL